jgi:branched-subunit amino acid aminotransferase/4-amino-4-deoxychorismate lyase
MHAWTIAGEPTKHLEPWGKPGAFSTLRLFPNRTIPFRTVYLQRILDSAKILQQSWIPKLSLLEKRLDEYLSESSIEEGLVRVCLFENSIGISDRPAISDGKSVGGWLLQYRRPVPTAKSTQEKELYGRLSELDLASEDWIIIDPNDHEIRESATCNLIFVKEGSLVIPEKQILQGIVLRHLLPALSKNYQIIRTTPKDQDLAQYDEILLCGTGRGVAHLSAIPELNWAPNSEGTGKKIRSIYEQVFKSSNA